MSYSTKKRISQHSSGKMEERKEKREQKLSEEEMMGVLVSHQLL